MTFLLPFALRRRLFYKKELSSIMQYTLPFLCCLLIIFLKLSAPLTGVLLIISLLGIIAIYRKTKQIEFLCVLSLWMSIYLLGTSSSTATLSLLALFPLFVGFIIMKSKSLIINGLLGTLIFWTLYIIPGNSFGYKVVELGDNFIMGSIVAQNALPEILLIGSRYILPIVLISFIVFWKNENNKFLPASFVALIPALLAIALQLFFLAYNGCTNYPWLEMRHLKVLSLYVVILSVTTIVIFSASKYCNSKQEPNYE
jgi:hypothetical protein